MPTEPILPLHPVTAPDTAPTVEKLRHRPETSPPTAPPGSLTPLLIDMAGLSRLLARSEASLYRDAAAGRLPAALKLGASKRWRYSEIVAWVEAGMPNRRTWEATKAAKKSNAQ